MFPFFIFEEFVESVKCDICQFARHHGATYSLRNAKSIHSFLMYRGLHLILVYLVVNGLPLFLMIASMSQIFLEK